MIKAVLFTIGIYIANILIKGFFCEVSLKCVTGTGRRLFLVNVLTLPVVDEVTRYLTYLWNPLVSLEFTLITTLIEGMLGFGTGVRLKKKTAIVLGLIQGIIHPVNYIIISKIFGSEGLLLALLLHMMWNDLVINRTLSELIPIGGDNNESN